MNRIAGLTMWIFEIKYTKGVVWVQLTLMIGMKNIDCNVHCRRLAKKDPVDWTERNQRKFVQSVWEVIRSDEALEFLNMMDSSSKRGERSGDGIQIIQSILRLSVISHCANPKLKQVFLKC